MLHNKLSENKQLAHYC